MAGEVERGHRVGVAALDASLTGLRELGLAAVAHLSRYRGTSREHTESDLRIFFAWCQDRQLAPLDLAGGIRPPADRAAGVADTRTHPLQF